MDINDLFEGIMQVADEFADKIEAARMRDQKCRTAKARSEWDLR